MLYLLQGIVLVLLLIAGLAASFPFLFILLDFFFRVEQEERNASLLPFVATIVTLPIIGLSVLIPSWFPKWIVNAAAAIFILDLLFIVPMLLYSGWQKLKGKW